MAAIPVSRITEPNAVFAYAVDGSTGRVTAVLFDRLRGKTVDDLDTVTALPVRSGKGMATNDAMQFSPATKKIYAEVHNVSEYMGGKIEKDLPYGFAIVETDFRWKAPTAIFSCDTCVTEQWLVHPTKPKLYLALQDAYKEGEDEFRNAKLIEVTLSPKRRTRVIGRIPARAALRITPDGKTLFAFGRAADSRKPYGVLTKINLATRTRTEKTVNFPSRNVFDLAVDPGTGDVSPDTLEVAYHMGLVDVQTGTPETLIKSTDYALDNFFIGWSRDSNRMLFQLREPGNSDNRIEVPLVYDRAKKEQWVLDMTNAHYLDWAPSQTAILFGRNDEIGFYDLAKRAWTHVFDAEDLSGADASWVTMPTKKVPKS